MRIWQPAKRTLIVSVLVLAGFCGSGCHRPDAMDGEWVVYGPSGPIGTIVFSGGEFAEKVTMQSGSTTLALTVAGKYTVDANTLRLTPVSPDKGQSAAKLAFGPGGGAEIDFNTDWTNPNLVYIRSGGMAKDSSGPGVVLAFAKSGQVPDTGKLKYAVQPPVAAPKVEAKPPPKEQALLPPPKTPEAAAPSQPSQGTYEDQNGPQAPLNRVPDQAPDQSSDGSQDQSGSTDNGGDSGQNSTDGGGQQPPPPDNSTGGGGN